MKPAILLALLLLAAPAPAAQIARPDPAAHIGLPEFLGHVPDRFIVVLAGDVPVDHAADAGAAVALSRLPGFAAAAERFGARRLQPQFPGADLGAKSGSPPAQALARHYTVEFTSGSLEQAMAAYRALPGVARVEPIGIHPVSATPNDPRYDDPPPTFPYDQWHYFGPYGISADLAWDTVTGAASVLVGVLDTGVKYDHGDLGGSNPPGPSDNSTNGNIWVNPGEIPGNGVDDDGNGRVDDVIGWDFVASTTGFTCLDADCSGADNDPRDGNGHGTHVAGTIAAITNNGFSVAGIAGGWGNGTFAGGAAGGVKIVPCRIGFTARVQGQQVGVVVMDYVAQAMYFMAELKRSGHNVAAVNCSFGSSNTGGIAAAADYLLAQDVMIIVAAGNSNSAAPSYLGSRVDCLDVGATDSAGNPASWSNYGSWVDIAAPGVAILSTYTDPGDPGTDYIAVMDGTSMACPHVVGVAALLEAYDPSLTGPQKWARMVENTRPYNPTRAIGSGIVNAALALPSSVPPPILSGPSLTPSSCTPEPGLGCEFAFSVTYQSAAGHPPDLLAEVQIRSPLTGLWTGHALTSADPTYEDGSLHSAVVTLSEYGTHAYRFHFESSAGGPVLLPASAGDSFSGPEVLIPPPTLSGNACLPDTGLAGAEFCFSVLYTDLSNDPVLVAAIDLFAPGAADSARHYLSTADLDYSDGAVFSACLPLEVPGEWRYRFFFLNTAIEYVYFPADSLFRGPVVEEPPVDEPPALSDPGFAPAQGPPGEEFRFLVTYSDPEGAPAAAAVLHLLPPVSQEWVELAMAPEDSGFAAGSVHSASLVLSEPGIHRLRFVFQDAAGNVAMLPADPDSSLAGPLVLDLTGVADLGAATVLLAAPNPANATIVISYTLAARADVSLDLFDLAGRRLQRLEAGSRQPGTSTVLWNGRDSSGRVTPSGIYVVRLVLRGDDGQTRVLSRKVNIVR